MPESNTENLPKYQGQPPVIAESDIQGQRIWLKVSETKGVQMVERVLTPLDKDLVELYKEIHFWRFANSIFDIKFKIASYTGDEEEMIRLKMQMKVAIEYLEFRTVQFWFLVKERYNLWFKGPIAVRVDNIQSGTSEVELWRLVEMPNPIDGSFSTLDDMVRRMLEGREP